MKNLSQVVRELADGLESGEIVLDRKDVRVDVNPAFVQFRQDLRQLLADYGIPTNPGWSERNIVDAFRNLLSEAKAYRERYK